jgi:hypothetical protein
MAIGNPITLTNNVASKTISVTATADQTLFNITGGYRINQVAVFRNGVRLADGADFTARDGSSVTLLSPANLSDTLEFQVFDDFRVADAIVSAEASQTINGDLTVTGVLNGVGGVNIGIQSAGQNVTTGVITALNFIGAGNTFVYDTVSKTVDISIAGGGGGGLGTAIKFSDGATDSPFSYIDREAIVNENMLLDTSTAGTSESIIVSVVPNINISSGVAVTVGTGKTMIIDVLQIGDL